MKKAMLFAALTLVTVAVAFAEDWEPPRLVDGTWVPCGVSDAKAKELAATYREEAAVKEQEAKPEAKTSWGIDELNRMAYYRRLQERQWEYLMYGPAYGELQDLLYPIKLPYDGRPGPTYSGQGAWDRPGGYIPSSLQPSPLPGDWDNFTPTERYLFWENEKGKAVELEMARGRRYTPGVFEGPGGPYYQNEFGQQIGVDQFGQFYQSPIPGSRMHRQVQAVIGGLSPKVPGTSLWQWRDGKMRRVK